MKQTKIRLLCEEALKQGEQITLPDNQSHYLVNVMRLKEGTSVRLFNARDGEFIASIIKPHKKKTALLLTEKIMEPRISKACHLYLTPLKKQALSYAIEKATECGVTDIHFMQTEFTDHTKVNIERLRATAIEAVEQCRRFDVPNFHEIKPLKEILSSWPTNQTLYVGAEDGRGVSLKEIKQDKTQIPTLMIGPEGGFSSAEFDILSNCPQTYFTSLGSNILRAETAVVVGVGFLLT